MLFFSFGGVFVHTLIFSNSYETVPYISRYSNFDLAHRAMLTGIWELLSQEVYGPFVNTDLSEMEKFIKENSILDTVSSHAASINKNGIQFEWVIING
jgi:hypothetical protein